MGGLEGKQSETTPCSSLKPCHRSARCVKQTQTHCTRRPNLMVRIAIKSGKENLYDLQRHMECHKRRLLGPATAPLGSIMSITFVCPHIHPSRATDPQSVNTLSDQTADLLNLH